MKLLLTRAWVIVAEFALILFLPALLNASGEETDDYTQTNRSALLAAYVPPALLLPMNSSAPKTATLPVMRPGSSRQDIVAGYRSSREVRRWMEFEDEFGIEEKSPSLVKGTLQSAKYGLDKTVFELDNFVNDLEEALEFEYWPAGGGSAGGSPRRTRSDSRSYFSPLRDVWDNTRLKSEIDLDLTGRAFVGVTLQFPFGN